MSLSVNSLERVFIFRNGNTDVTLPDPNPAMLPAGVMDFYSGTYAELTTATVHGPEIENDKMVYRFKTIIGTKG